MHQKNKSELRQKQLIKTSNKITTSIKKRKTNETKNVLQPQSSKRKHP
jgi:hypothetical protein